MARARALGLADHQLGLLTHVQLIRVGLSKSQIRHLVDTGVLIPIHRGVFRVAGNGDLSVEHLAFAACLACGDDALSSHRTAGLLRGLIDSYGGPVEVIVGANRRLSRPGIRVYRSNVRPDDRTTVNTVPITTCERTLLDLASCLERDRLEEAVDRAFRSRATTPERMDKYIPAPGESRVSGVATLRALVADRLGRGVPESVLESRMLGLLKRFRLPEPVRQFELVERGRIVRVDLAYPDQRVAIELEGRSPHWGRERWQSDHRRDNHLEIGDWRKLGFTWWDVTCDDVYVALTVGDALGLRPSSWVRAR